MELRSYAIIVLVFILLVDVVSIVIPYILGRPSDPNTYSGIILAVILAVAIIVNAKSHMWRKV